MDKREYKYFKLSEFDSPDELGSGEKMSHEFILRLDEARSIAKLPFKINSGMRTKFWNEHLASKGYKVAKNSAHMKGLAVDIRVKTSRERYIILNALQEVGLTRFGIGKTFLHVDCDSSKTPNLIWAYY